MDEEALEKELRALHSASFGWALACSDYRRDEAEDLLQTVYLKLLDGRARFAGRSSFKTWLFAVIRTTAKERRRRTLREQLGLALFGGGETAVVSEAHRTASAFDETERLRTAMKVLSERQREVIELVFDHELSIEEAASVMNVTVGTARTHYERAKQRLRSLLHDLVTHYEL